MENTKKKNFAYAAVIPQIWKWFFFLPDPSTDTEGMSDRARTHLIKKWWYY